MSIKLMSAAWDLDIPSTEKMVLMCLCDYADDEGGNCWPSVPTLARKCSKSERTIQGALQSLESMGYLEAKSRRGTSNTFQLNPRRICTPAESAPPQKTTNTPAESAPNPPENHQDKNTKRAKVISDDWKPEVFGSESKCAAIIAAWPKDEFETQVEHFTAHHRSKGSKFVDWQDAWKTWVLNSRKWAPRQTATGPPGSSDPLVAKILAKQRQTASEPAA